MTRAFIDWLCCFSVWLAPVYAGDKSEASGRPGYCIGAPRFRAADLLHQRGQTHRLAQTVSRPHVPPLEAARRRADRFLDPA